MFEKIIFVFPLFTLLGSGLFSFVLKKKNEEWKTKHASMITFSFDLIIISFVLYIISLIFMLIILFATAKF
jgi:uncharacterized membrane protein